MLTYNVGPAKLQLESQTIHLRFYDLIRALFRLNSELFVLSFILLQRHFRSKVTANDFQAYIAEPFQQIFTGGGQMTKRDPISGEC